MLATRQYAGATRISHYDDARHPTKSAVIVTIENGVTRFTSRWIRSRRSCITLTPTLSVPHPSHGLGFDGPMHSPPGIGRSRCGSCCS